VQCCDLEGAKSYKVISKQAAISVSHRHLLKAISKQAAFIVSHSHPLLALAPTILPPSL